MKKGEIARTIKNNRGQTAIEYVITAAALFSAFLAFYAFYSHIVPQQFESGARVILEVYDGN